MSPAKKTAKSATAAKTASTAASAAASDDEKYGGFSAEERAAMKERAQELKSTRRGSRAAKAAKADEEGALLAKIAEMAEADRVIAEKIHEIVTANAPTLTPRLYYGMPAYAKDGKVLCFFQPAQKFKSRYSTLGFNDDANLDEGTMWPTAFALTRLTAADEKRIAELVKQAVS